MYIADAITRSPKVPDALPPKSAKTSDPSAFFTPEIHDSFTSLSAPKRVDTMVYLRQSLRDGFALPSKPAYEKASAPTNDAAAFFLPGIHDSFVSLSAPKRVDSMIYLRHGLREGSFASLATPKRVDSMVYLRHSFRDGLRESSSRDGMRECSSRDGLREYSSRDGLRECSSRDGLRECSSRDGLRQNSSRDGLRESSSKSGLKESSSWSSFKINSNSRNELKESSSRSGLKEITRSTPKFPHLNDLYERKCAGQSMPRIGADSYELNRRFGNDISIKKNNWIQKNCQHVYSDKQQKYMQAPRKRYDELNENDKFIDDSNVYDKFIDDSIVHRSSCEYYIPIVDTDKNYRRIDPINSPIPSFLNSQSNYGGGSLTRIRTRDYKSGIDSLKYFNQFTRNDKFSSDIVASNYELNTTGSYRQRKS